MVVVVVVVVVVGLGVETITGLPTNKYPSSHLIVATFREYQFKARLFDDPVACLNIVGPSHSIVPTMAEQNLLISNSLLNFMITGKTGLTTVLYN